MTRSLPAPAALLGLAVVALLLAGCTSSFLVAEGHGTAVQPEPIETDGVEQTAEEDAQPDSVLDFDCDNVLIDRPGNYVLGDCGLVTIEGSGIDLTFSSIAELVIRGDGADLVGEQLGEVQIQGQRSDITVIGIGDLTIRGGRNTVVADGSIGTVVVHGNENVVNAADGIGSHVDNGLLNEIG